MMSYILSLLNIISVQHDVSEKNDEAKSKSMVEKQLCPESPSVGITEENRRDRLQTQLNRNEPRWDPVQNSTLPQVAVVTLLLTCSLTPASLRRE